MPNLSDRLKSRLKSMAKEFADQLPERMERIIEAYEVLKNDSTANSRLSDLRLQVHKLSGSGATFGFPELSRKAGSIEDYLDSLIRTEAPLTDKVWKRLDGEFEALQEDVYDTIPEIGEEGEIPEPEEPLPDIGDLKREIICVSSEYDASMSGLLKQLGFFGYPIHKCAGLDKIKKILKTNAQYCVIVHTETLLKTEGGDVLIRDLKKANSDRIFFLFLSDRNDFNTMLRSIRSGGDAFYPLPVDIARVIDRIENLLTKRQSEPYHVLIVDDDPEQVSYYALLLQQAGMITSVASDPKMVMGILVDAKPELILMDMYMPECNGMELASVIRQHDAFVSTPIVYLSIEENLEKQLDAIRIGGDGFISKTINPDYLLAFLTNMLERNRSVRYFMERDSLTGLLNHSNLKNQLDREVVRAERSGYPVCFAMIDADHFKNVNDSYGHLTGDKVLRTLARLLQDRLRRTDVIGRYGGEEFGIILLNTSDTDAFTIMDELRETFAHISHQAENEEFTVTFSCGIASYPTVSDPSFLSGAADKALYEAKETGRNRVVLYR